MEFKKRNNYLFTLKLETQMDIRENTKPKQKSIFVKNLILNQLTTYNVTENLPCLMPYSKKGVK